MWLIILTIIFLLFALSNVLGENLIVNKAKAEIGNGEIGGNNKGDYVKKYNRGLEAPWCAGFVSYILTESNIDSLEYSLSAKAIYNEAKQENRLTDYPQAGDLIVFWRGSKGSWKGHIGIIEKIANNAVHTIEGNIGAYPAKVSRFKYDVGNIPKLLGFIRTDKIKVEFAAK